MGEPVKWVGADAAHSGSSWECPKLSTLFPSLRAKDSIHAHHRRDLTLVNILFTHKAIPLALLKTMEGVTLVGLTLPLLFMVCPCIYSRPVAAKPLTKVCIDFAVVPILC